MTKRIISAPKIAYVVTPITFGGAERVNLNFLTNADRDRFSIEPILFLRPWEEETVFESHLRLSGIGYKTIPVAKVSKIDIFRLIRCYLQLKKIVDDNGYDLIHTHGYLANFFGYLVSCAKKIPIISTCHGFINEGVKLCLYNKLDHCILQYFNRIIAVSDQIKSDLISHGIESDKISVVVNAAQMKSDTEDFQKRRSMVRGELKIEQNEIIIGFVGRLSKEKGLVHLLDAAAMLVKKGLPVKVLIIGDGAQKNELVSRADSLDMAADVIFAGFQANVPEWVAAMDYFVLPSLTEGTPMALLEVMSQGVPCIASSVGGVPDIIDSGVDGILVAPGNPHEISEAILSLCQNREKRDDLTNNAKEKIRRKFNVGGWTAKIESEYVKLMQAAVSR